MLCSLLVFTGCKGNKSSEQKTKENSATLGPITVYPTNITEDSFVMVSRVDINQMKDYDEVGFIYSNEVKPTIDNAIKVRVVEEERSDLIEVPLYDNKIYYSPYAVRNGIYSYGEVNEVTLPLSFKTVSDHYEREAEKYAEEEVAKILAQDPWLAERAHIFKDELDIMRMRAHEHYLDSLMNTEVYQGYTLREVRAEALKIGMIITLQVQMLDLVKNLAANPTPEFEEALALAAQKASDQEGNLFDIFREEWEKVKNGQSLKDIFPGIGGSDDNVISAIKDKGAKAYENSCRVLSNRIVRFGIAQPNIQKFNDGSGRILVDIPGVNNPERIRKLLQGTGALEFWSTFTSNEIYEVLFEADVKLGEALRAKDPAASVLPIFDLIQYGPSQSACLGVSHKKDVAKINDYLEVPVVAEILKEAGIIPMWSAKPLPNDENMYELIAVKDVNKNGKPLLDGEAVESARAQLSSQQGAYEVSMSMTKDGVRKWAKITGDNIGRQVAIVLDDLVQSYPVVNQRIEGDSSISGGFTAEEARDLANVLECGKLDVPVRIISEQQSVGVK